MRFSRRIVLRVLAGLVVVVLLLGTGAYLYAKPLLLTGTGYAAHNQCAIEYLAGRTDAATDLPPNPLVPYLKTTSDTAEKSSETTIQGVIAGQKAWYTDLFGCTLAATRPSLGKPTPVTAGANPLTSASSPKESAVVEAAVAAAFGDELPAAGKAALGTRAIVALQHGSLIAERYAPGFTAQTPQLGWSMAKSVASLLTGRLVLEGRLTLETARLRSEWTDDRAQITVDQLLRMTSGLQWDETYDLGTPITRMLYLEPDMAAYVASLPLAHPVGGYQQYSSGSSNLLCWVLNQRARVRADLPRQQLFAPLGLTSAVWEPDATGTPVCSSYLWATPRDWAAIGLFALRNGVWGGQQLLPADWMQRTTTHQASAGEETGYAAGWWVNKLANGSLVDPTLPADAFWASGHDGQRLYVVPSADLVVVRLGFSPKIDAKDLRITQLVATLAKPASS